ncbi:unnamed protein product [Cuscuta epithymum]|uniref:Bet v I/Major latex protein domain-containing protein n=1 Tax=Cuscuta epithymum TaxID=186058 RepID=A0AAV0CSH0_9ASTE|nr:unnamed protein product [Cuscuta epithymum]
MGVSAYTDVAKSPIAAHRLFQAFYVDSHNLFPKVLPQVFSKIDLIPGQGGAPTIKLIQYRDGDQVKCMKNEITELDANKLVCKNRIVEGNMIGDEIETICYDVKFEANSGGGCTCTTKIEYHTKGDFVINEEEMKKAEEKSKGIFEAVQAYLTAHPDLYA